MKKLILAFSISLLCFISKANDFYFSEDSLNKDSLILIVENQKFILVFPDSLSNGTEKKVRHENKKLISAILAFPFPFGILGLHRIYLGTKPYMPFVYVGTLGGCFGILPLIDFIAILFTNDETLKHFENNPKVFMWTH